jgi:hypothetical protein
VGNVYDDLQRLEQAIAMANAEQNLLAQERLELLDNFAAQRRLLFPDLVRHVLLPLTVSFGISSLLWLSSSRRHQVGWLFQNNNNKVLTRIVWTTWDVLFWTVGVMAPLFLLVAKKLTTTTPSSQQSPPLDLKRLDPQYVRFLTTTDWENPRTSCRDYVLTLLEWWISSVMGMALFGIMSTLLRSSPFVAGGHAMISPFSSSRQHQHLMVVAQLATRIGMVASLHQFPKLIYQIQRPSQPRPMELYPTLLQPLIKFLTRTLPWAVVVDVIRWMMIQPTIVSSWRTLCGMYMTTAIMLVMALLTSTIRRDGGGDGGSLQRENPPMASSTSSTAESSSTPSPLQPQQQQNLLRRRVGAIVVSLVLGSFIMTWMQRFVAPRMRQYVWSSLAKIKWMLLHHHPWSMLALMVAYYGTWGISLLMYV